MFKYLILLIWCFFGPYIFQPLIRNLYCITKKIRNDGSRCYYWNCNNYLNCKYNKKCMNDTPYRLKRFDWLAFNFEMLSLFLSVAIIVVLYVTFF